MSAQNGYILGTTKILDNGSAASRFNIVLISEGYREEELVDYQLMAQKFVNKLIRTSPFDKMKPAINVYRFDVVSRESGPDDSSECGGEDIRTLTYFDSNFVSGGIRRLLWVNRETVQEVVNQVVPQWHQILVLVNSNEWGGSGGPIATTTVATGWENMAIHELRQAAFGLIDDSPAWDMVATDRFVTEMPVGTAHENTAERAVTQQAAPLFDKNAFARERALGRTKFFKHLFFQHLNIDREFWRG